MKIHDFKKFKQTGKKISMVTCYDYCFAKLLNASDVDCLLVGDSLAMVMHGMNSTIPATLEMMSLHTMAVVRGAPNKFIVADMPFLSFRKGLTPAMDAVETLMRAGASAVKLEGVVGHEEIISHITKSGIPIMGHLGLTPQFIHQLGGMKVQGAQEDNAKEILHQAQTLEQLGAFAIVLECVPSSLAKEISKKVKIPCIGIGAGVEIDGQVLVLHDLLGLDPSFKPKFLRHFAQGATIVTEAVNNYCQEVLAGTFPNATESYSSKQEIT